MCPAARKSYFLLFKLFFLELLLMLAYNTELLIFMGVLYLFRIYQLMCVFNLGSHPSLTLFMKDVHESRPLQP